MLNLGFVSVFGRKQIQPGTACIIEVVDHDGATSFWSGVTDSLPVHQDGRLVVTLNAFEKCFVLKADKRLVIADQAFPATVGTWYAYPDTTAARDIIKKLMAMQMSIENVPRAIENLKAKRAQRTDGSQSADLLDREIRRADAVNRTLRIVLSQTIENVHQHPPSITALMFK